jgi:hypothetical protein
VVTPSGVQIPDPSQSDQQFCLDAESGSAAFWAAVFPAQVDVFIAVGELALFVSVADIWTKRSRTGAWIVTLAGLAVSVAGNVDHVTGHDAASPITAGVPPVAATVALAVGLGVLKRVIEAGRTSDRTGAAPDAAVAASGDSGTRHERKPPSGRQRQRQGP